MNETTIEIGQLLSKIDAGDPLLLVDVRNGEEYRAWRVEGRSSYDTVHIPYFDFLEDESLVNSIPKECGEIFVLCAKGGSSEYVADLLREAGIPACNIAGGMLAYGEYLEPMQVPIGSDEDGHFELWQINRRGKGCLSYLIRSGDEAVVVDPSRRIDWYSDFAASLGSRIVHVFDTHVHADHLSGGPRLAPLTGARYFVAAGDGFELRHRVVEIADGHRVTLGGEDGVTIELSVLYTPGHTPGSTSLLIGRNHLITGDTLFVSGVGRPDLGGEVEAWSRMLFRSLRERLAAFPDDTVILPAHYSSPEEIDEEGVVSAALGSLRAVSPELQITDEEEFVAAMRVAVTEPPEAYRKIIGANLGIVGVLEEEAIEWELGKNECAAKKGVERGN